MTEFNDNSHAILVNKSCELTYLFHNSIVYNEFYNYLVLYTCNDQIKKLINKFRTLKEHRKLQCLPFKFFNKKYTRITRATVESTFPYESVKILS